MGDVEEYLNRLKIKVDLSWEEQRARDNMIEIVSYFNSIDQSIEKANERRFRTAYSFIFRQLQYHNYL